MNFDPRITALTIAAVLGITGLVILVRGLRPLNRGVRSCPKCSHLLGNSGGLRCPECGYVARNERALLRSNRRHLAALTGLLLLIGSLFLAQRVDQVHQLFGLAPDRFLVMLLPYATVNPDNEGVHAEVYNRARSGMFGPSGRTLLLDRIISGDDSATPGSKEWELKYGRLAYALRSGIPEDDVLNERFSEIVPVVNVSVPEKWPLDTPVVILIEMTRFDADDTGSVVRIRGLSDSPSLYTHSSRNRSDFPLALTLDASNQTTIDRSLELEIGVTPDELPMHTHEIDVRVNPTRSAYAELEPRDTARMRAILEKSVFPSGITVYEHGEPPWSLRFNPRATQREPLADVLIGVEVELKRNGIPARRSLIWWHGGVGRAAWETVFEDPVVLENAAQDDATWTLHISGDRDIALRATIGSPPNAEAWWNGSFEVPVRINPMRGTIPPREWEQIQEHTNDEPTC